MSMLSRLSSSNRIDDDDDARNADSTSEPDGDALDAPLLPENPDEGDADAAARREALRSCCARGLMLVKCLAAYLVIVSIGAGVLAAIAEWVVVAARRARGTDDDDAHAWWGCLCEQSVAAHWVDSSQPEKIPVVLSATLLQSIILAAASLLVAQRACVRMDWLGSAVVNVLFLTLAILLPPAASGWPAPTAISSSLATLASWAFRPFGDDGCKSSRRFARWCVVVSAAAVTTNVGVLAFLVWAERLRRRAAAAGEKRNQPRPRAVVALGGLALVGYAVAALARLGVSVLAQRSFDASFFDRWSVVAYVAGQPVRRGVLVNLRAIAQTGPSHRLVSHAGLPARRRDGVRLGCDGGTWCGDRGPRPPAGRRSARRRGPLRQPARLRGDGRRRAAPRPLARRHKSLCRRLPRAARRLGHVRAAVAVPHAASVSLHHHGDLGDRAPFALLAAFDHCGGGGRPRRRRRRAAVVLGVVSFFVCALGRDFERLVALKTLALARDRDEALCSPRRSYNRL